VLATEDTGGDRKDYHTERRPNTRKYDHLHQIPDVGIERDLHHRDHGQVCVFWGGGETMTRRQPHTHTQKTQQKIKEIKT